MRAAIVFLCFIACALAQIDLRKNGPEQTVQPHGSEALTPVPLTLWGITMGQPVPATLAKCAKHPTDNTPCIPPYSRMFDGKNSVVLSHLPYPGGELRLAMSDQRVAHMHVVVNEEYCLQVQQALEGKLGPTDRHFATRFQNAFGAQRDSETWVWPQADGSEVRYMTNVGGTGCELDATSAADVQRHRPAQVVQP